MHPIKISLLNNKCYENLYKKPKFEKVCITFPLAAVYSYMGIKLLHRAVRLCGQTETWDEKKKYTGFKRAC